MAKAHASAGEQLYMCAAKPMCAAKRTPCTTARPAEPAGPIVPTPCSAATADASESTHTSEKEAESRPGVRGPSEKALGYQKRRNRPGYPESILRVSTSGTHKAVMSVFARRCEGHRQSIAGEWVGYLWVLGRVLIYLHGSWSVRVHRWVSCSNKVHCRLTPTVKRLYTHRVMRLSAELEAHRGMGEMRGDPGALPGRGACRA